jgi:multidrug efflux pump subunit AcrA (membrane-fusion protein)
MKARSLLFVIMGLALAGCSREQKTAEAASAKPPEPLEIRTATVETRRMDKSISVTGSLHPDETVSVSAEVPGRVSNILVDFGQNVRKGQVIAELDKRPQRAGDRGTG